MESHDGADATLLTVGYLFPKKKMSYMSKIVEQTKDSIKWVEIDPTRPIHSQGAFDAILHKLAHDMVFAQYGDHQAAQRVRSIKDYLHENTSLKVIDPLESVEKITGRLSSCEALRDLASATHAFKFPRFTTITDKSDSILEKMHDESIRLPVIAKSLDACATEESHYMMLIAHEEGLKDITPPVLIQEYVNHSERLYKGYVIGDYLELAVRRSTPDIQLDNAHHQSQEQKRSLKFDSQKPYPSALDLQHSQGTEASTPLPKTLSNDLLTPDIKAAMSQICGLLRKHFKLSIFGFDVIIGAHDQEYYVVDVNYFPSFSEKQDLLGEMLVKHIQNVVRESSTV